MVISTHSTVTMRIVRLKKTVAKVLIARNLSANVRMAPTGTENRAVLNFNFTKIHNCQNFNTTYFSE